MAKAKAKKGRALPTGFTAITAFGDNWMGDTPGDFIQGKIAKIDTVHFEAQGKKGTASYRAARDVPKYFIDTGKGGTVGVLQSAGLSALSTLKKGAQVYIEYVGKKKLSKGRNPMREYIVASK